MLTLFIFIPVVIGLALLTVRPRIEVARKLAMAMGVVELAISILFLLRFDRNAAGLQFEQKGEWLPTIGLQYHLGLDGIGLIFVVLTTLVFCMSLMCSIGGTTE